MVEKPCMFTSIKQSLKGLPLNNHRKAIKPERKKTFSLLSSVTSDWFSFLLTLLFSCPNLLCPNTEERSFYSLNSSNSIPCKPIASNSESLSHSKNNSSGRLLALPACLHGYLLELDEQPGTTIMQSLTGDKEWVGCFVSGGLTLSTIVKGEPMQHEDHPADIEYTGWFSWSLWSWCISALQGSFSGGSTVSRQCCSCSAQKLWSGCWRWVRVLLWPGSLRYCQQGYAESHGKGKYWWRRLASESDKALSIARPDRAAVTAWTCAEACPSAVAFLINVLEPATG